MGVFEPVRYFRLSNMNQILLDAALYMPMAMAMTFVITQRGIDLSIGSVAALSAIIIAFLMKQYGLPAWICVFIALGLGGVMGLINGLVITRLKVPDLIGTLAMDLVYRGFALVLAKGLVLARFPDLITEIGRGQMFGILPTPVVIGLVTMVAGYFLLRNTHFGRYTIAIGSNPEASEMTGVSVDRHKIYAYTLMGAMAALAGMMLLGKLNAIQATSAPYFNLHVIAAVVVGGTSLFGGRPSVVGSHPEATVIHNANTAMEMGSVEAQVSVAAAETVFSTGWGGTGLELDAIRRGELDATPMRMGDDVGAATAEAIRYHLEGRGDELPFVFLGRINVAHDQMSADELAALEKEAFRFSGVEPLER